MEISCQLICPCNQKLYKSEASLKAHRKTQGHQFWESSKESKDVLIKINRLEIENGQIILLMERKLLEKLKDNLL